MKKRRKASNITRIRNMRAMERKPSRSMRTDDDPTRSDHHGATGADHHGATDHHRPRTDHDRSPDHHHDPPGDDHDGHPAVDHRHLVLTGGSPPVSGQTSYRSRSDPVSMRSSPR
jgi:hypothetical protein